MATAGCDPQARRKPPGLRLRSERSRPIHGTPSPLRGRDEAYPRVQRLLGKGPAEASGGLRAHGGMYDRSSQPCLAAMFESFWHLKGHARGQLFTLVHAGGGAAVAPPLKYYRRGVFPRNLVVIFESARKVVLLPLTWAGMYARHKVLPRRAELSDGCVHTFSVSRVPAWLCCSLRVQRMAGASPKVQAGINDLIQKGLAVEWDIDVRVSNAFSAVRKPLLFFSR